MLRAQVEDLLLEVLLLRLEVERRLDQRRPLLARVPDPRALGRELGGDEEPRARATPRRASPASSGSPDARRRAPSRQVVRSGARATARPPTTTADERQDEHRRRRRAGDGRRRRGQPRRGRGLASPALGGARPGIATPGVASGAPVVGAAPAPAGRQRPGGAGCGPYCSGRRAPRSASQPAWNVAEVRRPAPP